MKDKSDKNWKAAEDVVYKQELRNLQIELVKAHRHIITKGRRVLVILEGRDAAGKDGSIKRIVEHLSPRETRVVALGKPSDRELGQWYFQRYCAHLPSAGEFVLFNRSWYNRAGVEKVMGFCTEADYTLFMKSVIPFEKLLVDSGMQLFKYYLDISRHEQKERLAARATDPLTQWKISEIDNLALEHWADYSEARDKMLESTHHRQAPWSVIRTDDKHQAHLNLIRDLLQRIDCSDLNTQLLSPNPNVVFQYESACVDKLAH